jgi:NitT/TauT family transport system substrate-binding protein
LSFVAYYTDAHLYVKTILKHYTRNTLFIVAALVLAGIGAYILWSKEPGRGNGGKTPTRSKIKIVDGLSANSIHVLLADKLGYFKEEDLDVEVSYAALGKFAMDALNADSVQYAGVVEMNIAQTLFTHKDVAILCEYSQPVTGIKVLGRKDKGVESAKNLRGKKIGVFFGVNIHVFMTKVIEEQGISESEVELVNLTPPAAVVAFTSGSIDAVITWQPHVYNIQKQLGDNAVIITQDDQKYWPYKLILATKRSYLNNHSEEAKKVLKAMIKADEFIRNEPEKAYSLLSQHLNLDPKIVPDFCKEIHYEVRLTKKIEEMIAYEIEWFPKHLPDFFQGKTPVTTDFRSLVADELKSIKESAFMKE